MHVYLWCSSSRLKEDEMTKYYILKMKLFPFDTFLFLFQSHFFPCFFFFWFFLMVVVVVFFVFPNLAE